MKCRHTLTALILSFLAASAANAESPVRPGDRVAIIGNTFADQLRVHGYLETLLLQRSSGNPVSIRNLGWGGDMLSARDRPTNFPSEESTLKEHQTDVIIACFGMGESFAGKEGIEDFQSQLRSLIASHRGKSYNGKTEVRLILVSPIAYEDLGRLTPKQVQRNQDLQLYSEAMRKVASEEDVAFVDLFSTSRYLMDEPEGPSMTTNGIHLNPYGYWAISRSFCDQLIDSESSESPASWQVTVDAAATTGEGRGAKVLDISRDGAGLSFFVKETSAPNLAPPSDVTIPPPLQLNRDTLVVKNLKPGSYQLTVDGQEVITADAKAWSEGVAIDSSPAHREAEKYRALVTDKNLQFTYSWKALNQVHIVGERKTSPSGKELPREVVEFNDLANKLDMSLRHGIKFKTRLWRITPVSK